MFIFGHFNVVWILVRVHVFFHRKSIFSLIMTYTVRCYYKLGFVTVDEHDRVTGVDILAPNVGPNFIQIPLMLSELYRRIPIRFMNGPISKFRRSVSVRG